ncbi:MAG: translation initiation factor IF-2 [Clostridiales bacterium]|nr:translation initiation factor IF-2 [Clostridiales bacterium]
MSIRVYELAKILDMESKQLLEKLNAMGIEAKSHNSVLSDIDAKAIRNMILHSRRKSAETKIVKVATKKPEKAEQEEVKISVKPAAVATKKAAVAKEQKAKAEQKPAKEKPTKTSQKPKASSAVPSGQKTSQPPIGVPLPKSASLQPVRDKEPKKAEIVEEVEAKVQEKKIPEEKMTPKADTVVETKPEPSVKKAEKKKEKQVAKQAEDRIEKKAPKKKMSERDLKKKDFEDDIDESGISSKKSKKAKKEKDKPEQKKKVVETRRSMEKPAAPKKSRKQKAEPAAESEDKLLLENLEPGSKIVNVPITVRGLSEQIGRSTSEIILALMELGVMANVNQNLDEDTVVLLGESLGVNIVVAKVEEDIVEEGLEDFEDPEEDLVPRPPIITVMGHVDHGKTSLLDAIRKTNVTDTESGGITQHIGASEVVINDQRIVFLDTPGHEAFTAMRARGAHVTDIAVLVVAADDSVKPQTVESINHAKAAGVPIIVAINKMDKETANPDKVKQDLAEHGILVEEWGGETICVPVSAKKGEGIVNLLEMILLQAEMMELKANPNRLAKGTVIEARLDKSKGPVATLLVQNGTLETGMPLVAGVCSGKVRAMVNSKGERIRKAGPATAVEIIGLTEVAEAGDEFHAVKDEKIAREIAEQRKQKLREEVMAKDSSVTLEELFSQIQEGEAKELNLIIKADVQGSVGALIQSLEKLQTDDVKIKIIHSGVGTVSESDIMLANTANAIIIGFNVRPTSKVTEIAEREKVEIRTYQIIYDVLDDIEAAIKGMLDPEYKEVIMGKIEIRNIFKVPGVGKVGGAYVLEGKVQRNADIRLIRDGVVIHTGKISSLKRYKDDVREVMQGYECGIGIENYNDIKEGDIIEAFQMEEIAR